MALDLRLFIDFWNFQLNWNMRASGALCDWTAVSRVFLDQARDILTRNGLGAAALQETRIYASYEQGRNSKLKNWLEGFLDKQLGFSVIAKERLWRQKAIHCRVCGTHVEECPHCKGKFGRAAEEMVDSRIVADLLSMAWDGIFDIAILLTSDADMIPAVESLQRHDCKVINATWRGHGQELAQTAWASFEIDDILEQLKRV